MGFFSSAFSNGRMDFPGVSESTVFRAVLEAAAQCRMGVQNADQGAGFILLRANSTYEHWKGALSVTVAATHGGATATISGATEGFSLTGTMKKASEGEFARARGKLDAAIRRAVAMAPESDVTRSAPGAAILTRENGRPVFSHQKLWSSVFGQRRDHGSIDVFDDSIAWTYRGAEASIPIDRIEAVKVEGDRATAVLIVIAYGQEYPFGVEVNRARVGARTIEGLIAERNHVEDHPTVSASENAASVPDPVRSQVARAAEPDPAERIASLHALLQAGAISQDEYNAKKAQLLEQF